MTRSIEPSIDRRDALRRLSGAGLLAVAAPASCGASTSSKRVQTVLGPVSPDRLGATLMHEHVPLVDWSELYGTGAASWKASHQAMVTEMTARLKAYHAALNPGERPGTIVDCTPIRVGRYPELLEELARRTPVQIVACTGFWCEAMAPQHPWALRLLAEPDGVRQIAKLYEREITQGIEDPTGAWGERFTNIRAGIIKVATSTIMRASERGCHEAAALASRSTGCPITTHTTEGGGLEQAQLLLARGVLPEKIIIGHQGYFDDGRQPEADDLHVKLAELGCYVQFDRVGHPGYETARLARQIKHLVGRGHGQRVLVGHDQVPFFYGHPKASPKPAIGWEIRPTDFTIALVKLRPALLAAGVSADDVRKIFVDNPRRALAF